MTISFYSPMPPARTGVADYSAALVRALREHAEVEVNPEAPRGVPLYQIGNNPLHAGIYRKALDHPGAVVLHDAVLHHFLLGSLQERLYIDEFVHNYGAWLAGLAQQLWRDRARSAQDERYFRYPMLRRLVDAARIVIVHNSAAAAIVRAHRHDAPVHVIPHLYDAGPPADGCEVERLRHRLGVPAGGFLFGVFGHLRESKRMLPLLRVFSQLHHIHPAARLLVAGQFISTDLARAVEPFLCAPGVIRVPYLPERDFHLHASAVDACINLRHPAAGETSGIAVRLMGLCKAVLLSAGAENEAYPEAGCFRIDTGLAEEEMLGAAMIALVEQPELAFRMGREGACHIAREHAPERVAQRFLTLLAETRN